MSTPIPIATSPARRHDRVSYDAALAEIGVAIRDGDTGTTAGGHAVRERGPQRLTT